MVDQNMAFEKLDRLRKILLSYKSVLVAFSGGVDSTFLLKVAKDVLDEKAVAVFSNSLLVSSNERKQAQKIADLIGTRLIVIERDILQNDDFMKNDKNRCYYCKKDLIRHLKRLAHEQNLDEIAEGSNLDDLNEYRPGKRALLEEGIKSPLIQAGLTKAEIRFLSKQLGLPTHDKPSIACLVTRIPYEKTITSQKLSEIERAEQYLFEKGFKKFRVRHHDEIARIEIDVNEMPNMFDLKLLKDISNELKSIGFRYVTLDLCGYKQGSFD